MSRIPSTPSTTPKATERTKTPPSTPSPKPTKTATANMVEKVLKDADLPGAANEAKKGVNHTAEAIADKRNGAVVAYRAGKAAVATGLAAVGDLGNKAVEGARGAAEAIEKATKPITEPFVREIKEAGSEIGEAGKNVADTVTKSADELRREVSEEFAKGDGNVEKYVGAAGEFVENAIEGSIATAGSLANAGKEIVEGAIEITLNNPNINAVKEAGKGIVELGKGAIGWIGDRIDGGVEGAKKATKTASSTNDRIEARSAARREESIREVGDAGKNILTTGVNSWNNLTSEVADEWEKGEGIEKGIGAVGEVAENVIEGGISHVGSVLNLYKEIGENAGENAIASVQNAGEAIAGGFEAAGDFLGGLFG